jgi:hypothetical protein
MLRDDDFLNKESESADCMESILQTIMKTWVRETYITSSEL